MNLATPRSRRMLLSSAALAAAALAVPRPAFAGGGLRAAFLYVGPVGADLWSYAHDQGRLAMARQTGIETAFTQSVTPDEAERVLRDYARQGYDVIFSTSFDFAEATLRVARDYPNVIFEQATGVQSAPNVGTYDGRSHQTWYLAGIVAGAMSRTGALGYVAPYPIPEVVRHINAFTLGARAVNPAASVRPRWISTWFNPPVERAAAELLIARGAEVVASEADSDAAARAAATARRFAIGYNAVPPGAPDSILTAPIWHWDVVYRRIVEQILAGRWSNAPIWWGLAEGLVGLAPFSASVPAEVRVRVEFARMQMLAGALYEFAGPLTDNTGRLRVPAGQRLTDADLLTFNWLVDGVVGSLPDA